MVIVTYLAVWLYIPIEDNFILQHHYYTCFNVQNNFMGRGILIELFFFLINWTATEEKIQNAGMGKKKLVDCNKYMNKLNACVCAWSVWIHSNGQWCRRYYDCMNRTGLWTDSGNSEPLSADHFNSKQKHFLWL